MWPSSAETERLLQDAAAGNADAAQVRLNVDYTIAAVPLPAGGLLLLGSLGGLAALRRRKKSATA